MKRLALLILAASPAITGSDGVVRSAPQDLVTPVSEDSAFPQLAADGKGGVFMTWIETLKAGAGHMAPA